jgi:hypothetical protein
MEVDNTEVSRLERYARRLLTSIYPPGTEVTYESRGLTWTDYGRNPDYPATVEAQGDFVEELSVASADEVRRFAERMSEIASGPPGESLFSLPVWVHILVYRLLTLHYPNDASIWQRAANACALFGPDFREQADEFERKARALEEKPAG